MKTNTILTTAALAGMMFIGQGAMAQQSADRQADDQQSSSGTSSDASSSQANDPSDAAATAGARDRQGQGSRGQSAQNMDQKFVEFAATNDLFEIQASQLAEQQAQDDQIKQLAMQLRRDHEQTSKQLQQVAQQAGIQVPSQLKPHQQAMLQELKQMQGEEFDKAFLYGNVAGHVKAILKFRDAAKMCQNPQLKQFAQQTLPKLQQHLQHAEQLAQWDEASAQTAGARERASSPGSRTGIDRSSNDTNSDSATGAGSSSTGRSGRSNTGTGSGTSDAGSPGSSSSQQGGSNDTGSGASSDSASGGRSPGR